MSDAAISLRGVGKMYKLYPSKGAHLVAALGGDRLLPRARTRAREFWALRGIDLHLQRGQRVGVIGRNGAGKSTLLKLITGNLAPSEGTIEVHGEVRALIDAGGGFHPEFTGYENIRSALIYQGFRPSEIRAAEQDIADFTELGEFLDQPFKTYSLGMQTRLTFATATAIKPDILIVDEILGAGDAYFLSKSTERMRELVSGGATVLLVSHSLDQVMMFCDEAIWIDRGRIVERGPSLEVCKAYEKHIKVLEDRRLRAKNLKVTSGRYRSMQFDEYGDHLIVRFEVQGGPEDRFEISAAELLCDGQSEERLLVGEAQDAETSQAAFVVLDACEWSAPKSAAGRRFRQLAPAGASAVGQVLFYLWAFFPDSNYSLGLTYRTDGAPQVLLRVLKSGSELHRAVLEPAQDWSAARLAIQLPGPGMGAPVAAADEAQDTAARADLESQDTAAEGGVPTAGVTETSEPDPAAASQTVESAAPVRAALDGRWPGEGSVMIDAVRLLDGGGAERAVFQVGEEMVVDMACSARRADEFPVIPVAVLFRRDGVLVSRFIGDRLDLRLGAGEKFTVRLPLGRLNLGNAHYVFSVALYRKLDVQNVEPVEIYDLIDRSYEFEVYGTPPLVTGVFQHPGRWEVRSPRIRAGRR